MKQRTAIKTDLFADEHHRKKIDTLGDPLVEIESCIDFAALAAEVDRVAPRPVSPQGGRPPYPTETMVRILVLKRLYNLSDEQMAYQLLDRMSYKRFCGLANASTIPDRTTVWTFENRIDEAGRRFCSTGSRPNCSSTATWLGAVRSSMRRWCPHRSNATAVNRTSSSRTGRCRLTGSRPSGARKRPMPPGPRNTASATNVFYTLNTSWDVHAERGYTSKGREDWLKDKGYRNQIQRKGTRNKPLSECQQGRNHRIAKSRARIEHVFAAIDQMGGKTIRTIGQARANFAMTMMAACYNLKRLVYFQKAGIEAF